MVPDTPFHRISQEPLYILTTKVAKVFIHDRLRAAYKRGDEIIEDRESIGWFVLLEGSHEALFLGLEKPALEPGDVVRITIQKVQ